MLPDEEVDVVLVAVGVGQLDHPLHEVHRRGRAEAAEHPDRLVAHRTRRHRATKCLRNLRTWFTW